MEGASTGLDLGGYYCRAKGKVLSPLSSYFFGSVQVHHIALLVLSDPSAQAPCTTQLGTADPQRVDQKTIQGIWKEPVNKTAAAL